jgi:hypothetical protein
MQRRDFLRAGTLAGTAAFAGCTGLFETQSVRADDLVEDPPDSVYFPSHVDGMEMAGMSMAGPYKVALAYTFPHRFWTLTGTRTKRVEVGDGDDVHLMATVWDADSWMVVPTANNTAEVRKGGDSVDERSLWPMLSQPMGFHFGDNVALDGDGTYTASVQISPPDARSAGEFEGRFDEAATADVEFEFEQTELDTLSYEPLDEKKGKRGAVGPMDVEMMPTATTPARESFPGEVIQVAKSGDAEFVFATVEADRFGDGTYFAVSPRTPYNAYPLPFMGLSASVERDGESVFDDSLAATLDPELGYHYGASVEGIESGDAISLTVETPPQVSRHQGYETAFVEMPGIEITV